MEKPTTSYEVIFEMFTGSGQLSKQANIKYTHITLDVNVAIIEFHVQWNQPENQSKVINLGKIHVVMDFLVRLDQTCLGAHWRKLYVGQGYVPCYEHGIVWKGLQSLSDITKLYRIAIERLQLPVAHITYFEEFREINSLEFGKKYLTDYQSVIDNALAGRFRKTAQSRFQYC